MNLIFRDHVEIDGFIPLILLVITMILVEWSAEAIYRRLANVRIGGA